MSVARLRSRRTLSLSLLAIILVSVISIGQYPLPSVSAQGGGNVVTYGESVMGVVSNTDVASYSFEAAANDVVEITVLGFGFNPSLQVLDNTQTQVLSENINATASSNIELSYAVPNAGIYVIHVRSIDGNSGGNFGLTLNRGQRILPPGITLELGSTLQGSISDSEVPVVYDLVPNPNGVSTLHIRSITGGYSPSVTILSAGGEPIFSMNNPRLLGFSVFLAPSNEALKLVIDLGSFEGTANFDVGLVDGGAGAGDVESSGNADTAPTNDNTIGLLTAPAAGCFLTVGQNTNIRQGGSTDHPIVAVLGENKFLVVTGYNGANSGWYQVRLPNGSDGWLASFVASTGGDCGSLPTATYPPAPNTGNGGSNPDATEEPSATATPPQAPTTNTQFLQIRIVHSDQTVSGTVSYPDGINYDFVSITYVWDNPQEQAVQDDVEYELVCTGEGVELVSVSGANLTGCNQTSTAFYSEDGVSTEQITISADGQPGVNVQWELRIEARN